MDSGYTTESDAPWLRPELVASWKQVISTIVLMLGSGVIYGVIYGLRNKSGAFLMTLSDHFLLTDAAVEAPMLGLFILVLRARGWKPSDLRLRIGWLSSFSGIGLFLLTYLGIILVMLPLVLSIHFLAATDLDHWLAKLVPHEVRMKPGSVHLSWIVILCFTFLNAFYEELVYMSYLFNQCAAKSGPAIAFAATVLVRLSVHTYQGTEHVLQIGTWSLVFGLFYWWGKKVWPLVLAHAIIDFFSFGALKTMYG